MAGAPAEYGTCTLCGDAVPPAAAACPTCGAARPAPAHGIGRLPGRIRHRLRFVQSIRALVVVAVVVGLAYVLFSAVLAGPPSYPDPLTTRGTYQVVPGGFTYLSGAITGEDYIVGNYSVVNPPGALIAFEVFNSTEMLQYAHHERSEPILNVSGQPQGRIVFAAPYTDTFYLVFANPYAPTTGIALELYVATTYQSNVVLG